MAVVIKTDNPQGLLSAIKEAIDKNTVRTWSYDSDGDFTHSPTQWVERAWLRPRVRERQLVFYIVPPYGARISRVEYGIYHGRFIEMLLNHFDMQFTHASATALPASADRVTGPGVEEEDFEDS